ncbi:hypothetical protein R1flu_019568 [Riccia fluitans]|uniref:Uncharacterized protein n=1 Tax=Riccia fluitans TaxID=41844 RepID=A0ABD1ZKH2_9MARC
MMSPSVMRRFNVDTKGFSVKTDIEHEVLNAANHFELILEDPTMSRPKGLLVDQVGELHNAASSFLRIVIGRDRFHLSGMEKSRAMQAL